MDDIIFDIGSYHPMRRGESPRPVLILDFDGTIALGSGPIEAYAYAVASRIQPNERSEFKQMALTCIDSLNNPTSAEKSSLVEATASSPTHVPHDGYEAVKQLAEKFGVNPAELGEAYVASREQLATENAPILAPEGLRAFLTDAHQFADIVLVTNSPDVRIPEALDILNVTDLIDTIITSAAKPLGFSSILDEFDGRPVISVGDVLENDLLPVSARGGATAFIGLSKTGIAASTFAAETLHELYPDIISWLSQQSSPSVDS